MHPWKQPPRGERHCALFDTDIGPCGAAWNGEGLMQVVIGEGADSTLERLRWENSAEAAEPPWPAFVDEAITGMQRLLRGDTDVDLSTLPLDWTGIGRFEREVYEAARRIGPGRTVTCDELAELMGAPGNARAVDVALSRNSWPLVVPDHRILSPRDERRGIGAGAEATVVGHEAKLKQRLLSIESRPAG
jgi:O-6-methylguanine DNA methyltransferase